MSEAEDDTNHQLRMFWDVDTFGVRVDKTPIYSHSEQRAIKIMKVIVPADGVGLRISIAMETESTTIAKQLHHGRERLESGERHLGKTQTLRKDMGERSARMSKRDSRAN